MSNLTLNVMGSANSYVPQPITQLPPIGDSADCYGGSNDIWSVSQATPVRSMIINGGRHVVTETEIIEFARRYDPQWFHTDPERAAASRWQGLIASGWHTCSVMMGMLVRNAFAGSTSMGSPGIDEIRWLKPVRVGDTLTMMNVVVDKRVSESKPDRGIVSTRWEGFNQHGEMVITVSSKGMFGLRHPGAA